MLIRCGLAMSLALMQPPAPEQTPILSRLAVRPVEQIGNICDVAVKNGGSEDNPVIVVLGMRGFTTCQLDRLPAIEFSEPTMFTTTQNGRIVEDGDRLWLLRGYEHWASAVGLYDESGQLVWQIPPDPKSPDWKGVSGVEFALPLRTPDGLAFAIGFNGTDAIAMVLPGSHEPVRYSWKRIGSEAFAWDVDGDGTEEIAYPTAKNLAVRQLDGAVVTTIAPTQPGYINDVFPTHYPDRQGDKAVCIGYFDNNADRQRYEVFNSSGKLLGSLNSPVLYRPATEFGQSGYYFRTQETASQGGQVVGIETNRLHLSVYRNLESISSAWIDPGEYGPTRVPGGSALLEQDGKWTAIVGFGSRLYVYRVNLPPQTDQ